MTRVGDAIRKAREARGWSVRILAHRHELDASQLKRVEGGVYLPTAKTLRGIARALEMDGDAVSAAWLADHVDRLRDAWRLEERES